MIQASKVIRQGKGLAKSLIERGHTLEIPWHVRCTSSFSALSLGGDMVQVSLSDEPPLRGGDVLVAEDGSFVRIVAANQPLMRVSRDNLDQGDVTGLAQAAYQLGKRDVAVAFDAMHLLVERRADVKDLLLKMRLAVTDCEAAFEPTLMVTPWRPVPSKPRHLLIFGPATSKEH